MRGDGLYRIPKSPFWYYRLKENGRWRGVSTKTTSYQDAKRLRRKALQDQEEVDCLKARLPAGPLSEQPCSTCRKQPHGCVQTV